MFLLGDISDPHSAVNFTTVVLQARVVEKPLKNMNEKKISNPFDDDATTKSCSKITVVTKFSVWEGRFLNQDPVNSSTP